MAGLPKWKLKRSPPDPQIKLHKAASTHLGAAFFVLGKISNLQYELIDPQTNFGQTRCFHSLNATS